MMLTPLNRRPENVLVYAFIVAELELGDRPNILGVLE